MVYTFNLLLLFLVASSFSFYEDFRLLMTAYTTEHCHPQRPSELPLSSIRNECSPSISSSVCLSVVFSELQNHVYVVAGHLLS